MIDRFQFISSVCVVLSWAGSLEGGTTGYKITDLGVLDNPFDFLGSGAVSLNQLGEAAGISAVSGGSEVISKDPHVVIAYPIVGHAVRWTARGIEDLGVLGPDVPPLDFPKPESWAFGINDLGIVVGRAAQPFQLWQGFIWMPEAGFGLEAGMNAAPVVPNGHAQMYAVNTAVQIVGEAPLPEARAYLWEHVRGEWSATDLGTLGGPYGRATAINELGEIAGQANNLTGNIIAFLWLPAPAYGFGAGIHDIGSSIHPAPTNCHDISNEGAIVGVISTIPFQAFIWLPEPAYTLPAGGSILNHADVPSGIGAESFAINDHGVIVGDVTVIEIHPILGPIGVNYAMKWENGEMVRLNDLIPDSGWNLNSARDINNDGQITGRGFPPGEVEMMHAFLMTPIDSVEGDLDDDGDVDFNDLLMLLAAWGECAPGSDCPEDLDESGDVGFADLLVLLSNWS